MDLGIYLDLRNPAEWRRGWVGHYAGSVELVEEAERLGAASVWLSEHHLFDDGYLTQPLTFAAALAARTSRIRIGTSVLLATLRPAALIAEEAILVDLLSNGRLDLGVGIGYRVPEFELYDVDITQRYTLIEERISDVQRLMREVTPPPVQSPIPLWGGFFGPRGARISGRLGIGLMATDRGVYEAYLRGLLEGGFGVADARIKAPINIVVANDPEAAWARIRPHFSYMYDSYSRYQVEGTDKPVPPPIDADSWRLAGSDGSPPRLFVVTPARAVEVLKENTAGRPIQEIFTWASIAGMPDDLVQEHLELWCTKVAPAVRDFDPLTAEVS